MILAATFVTCFVGGLFPLVNADLFIVGAALLTPWHGAVALIVVAVAGQLAGKVVIFVAMRRVRRPVMRLLGRPAIRLAMRARAVHAPACSSRAGVAPGNAFMFVSAAVGLPPLAATTLAAAGAGISLQCFVIAAGLGRTVRTMVIVVVLNTLVGG